MSKLPTADAPIRMDPALSEAVEDLLDPYSGDELAAAQEAVREVYESGFSGRWDALLGRYEEAIREAVEAA